MQSVIFPGQGAQYIGMGQGLYANPKARAIFDKADDVLGCKLSDKCFNGPAEDLKQTSLQQLAIMTVSLAAYEVFKQKDLRIDYFSGLSLGEYSCLYPAGVLSLEDVVILVKERGQAMQEAAQINASTMFVVIGLEQEKLKVLADANNFYIANLNAPGQIAISLAMSDKEKIKTLLESSGIKVIELQVSGGFHSVFMKPAAKRLIKVIDSLSFKDASIPIVSNVDAKGHTLKDEIKSNLINQLTSTVLWQSGCEFMIDKGTLEFYEIGPGKVLKGLMRKINSQVKVINLEKSEEIDKITM